MDQEQVRQALTEQFPGIDEEVLVQCISMCQMFNKTPEDLRYKWEAIIYSSSGKDQPIAFLTPDSARELRQQLQRDLAKQSQVKAHTTKGSVVKKVVRSGATSSASSAAAKTRIAIGSGVVKAEPVAPSLVDRTNGSVGRPVNFSLPYDVEGHRYRYMHEKIHERASILDERIDSVAELVRQHYKLQELGDPSAVTLDEIVVIGRIINDGDAKLGEGSLLLESSRMMGSGVRVPLEFGAGLKVRWMIVALKGKNGSGSAFVVSEILRLPPLPPSSKTEGNASLRAIIACGPFTFDSDLDYKPFNAIIEATRREQPDLLLLLGPFVDSNHALIKSGQVEHTPAMIFRERISKPLTQLEVDLPELVITLIPSIRDLISSHVVLPQAALERELGISRVCTFVCELKPADCSFAFPMQPEIIGATSVDVLFHVRKDSFFKPAQETADESVTEQADAMTMLCRQIIEQQSFYPIFPVPRDVYEDVNLSVVHSELLKIGEYAPDILVLPSRLKEFQKDVDSTMVVNPGLSTKFSSTGTAVCLSLGPRTTGAKRERHIKPLKLGA